MNSEELFERYYETFHLPKTEFNPAAYEREAARLSQFLPKFITEKEASILDLGCGSGFVLHYLKQHGFNNYLGVDFSEEAVALCRDHVTDRVVRSDAIGFLESELQSARRYDAIVMFDALHHFEKEKIVRLFKLCHSALNPGGVFAVKVVNLANLTGAQLLASDFTNLTGFSESSIEHLYRLAGFRSITFDDQRPKRLFSRGKYYVERAIHRFVYWSSRTSCPRVVSRKFIAVGKK